MVPLFPKSSPARLAGRLLLAIVGLVILWEVIRVVGLENQHTVIPGRVYRCAQPSESLLREEVERHGIRTVINLRGFSTDTKWYSTEARTSHALNVSQEDITFSANRLPAPAELRRLVEVLDGTEYPVLIHCKRGADRTGLTATIVHLLYTDATLSQARRQLWPRYGHFEFGRTAAMDQFFNRYESWLEARKESHSPARFREWIANGYSPGPHLSKLTWLDPIPNPVPADKPFAVRLRAVNTSPEPWELKPGNYAGIHLDYMLAKDPTTAAYRGQAGLQRATIPPGGEIVFTLAVPPLKEPGQYALVAQMIDATGTGVPIRANSFVQFGDEAILAEVIVK